MSDDPTWGEMFAADWRCAIAEKRRELMATAMTLTAARQIIGSLGFPTKMPGSSYGLPARACIAGAKLALVPGSVCAGCYAMKDAYSWPNSRKAQERRLLAISSPHWVAAMVQTLAHTHRHGLRAIPLSGRGKFNGARSRLNAMGYHRWHDSGDIQSVGHFAKICEVARRTPKIRHWLPTQELGMVKRFLASGGAIPDNLVIRVSTVMLDDPHRRAWSHTSSVSTQHDGEQRCPAPSQSNECRDCRACWSRDVPHVTYAAH